MVSVSLTVLFFSAQNFFSVSLVMLFSSNQKAVSVSLTVLFFSGQNFFSVSLTVLFSSEQKAVSISLVVQLVLLSFMNLSTALQSVLSPIIFQHHD